MSQSRAKIIIDEYEILDFIKEIKQTREKLWMWQPEVKGNKRRIHLGTIKVVNFDKKTLDIRPSPGSSFKFPKSEQLYVFTERRKIGFRVKVKELSRDYLFLYFPKKLNQLTGDEFASFSLVEDENEEKFKHLRTTPRKSAMEGQYVEIMNITGPHPGDKNTYQLHDISSGGMGFLTFDPGDFSISEVVQVLSINGKPPAKEIKGEVVAIRKLDGTLEMFKVGVKFIS